MLRLFMAMAVRARSGDDASFSKKDFREGNIGPERIREIIRNVIYQIDPKYADNPALAQKMAESVKAIVKEFKFVKHVPGPFLDDEAKREQANEYYLQLTLCNENQLSILINRANIELIHFEQSIRHLIRELLKDSYIRMENARERRSRENYNAEITDFDREKLIFEARLKAAKDIELAQLNLNYLIGHRDDLIVAIQEDKKAIQSSRNYRANNISVHAKQLRVGGVQSFEGMSDEQIDRFAKGRLEILEVKIRLRIEYERKIQGMIDAEIERLQPKTYHEKHKIEQGIKAREGYNEKIASFDQDELETIRELGHSAGHKYINLTASAETFKEHITSYDNDKGIKQETDAHVKVATPSIQNIILNEIEKKRTENEIKEDAIPKIQSAVKKGKEGVAQITAFATTLNDIDTNLIGDVENDLMDIQETLADFDFDSDDLFGMSTEIPKEAIQANAEIVLSEEDNLLYKAKNIRDLDFSGPTLRAKDDPSPHQIRPS